MKEFVGLKAKTHSYFTDDRDESRNSKGTNEFLIKKKKIQKMFRSNAAQE